MSDAWPAPDRCGRQIHRGKGPTVPARVEMEWSRKRGCDGSGLDPNPLGLRKRFLWKQLPQRKQLPPRQAFYCCLLPKWIVRGCHFLFSHHSTLWAMPPTKGRRYPEEGEMRGPFWIRGLNNLKLNRNITGLSKKPQSVGICRCWVQSYPSSSFWK